MSVEQSVYTVTIDYAQTLQEMIAAGKYDSVHEAITAEHFPVSDVGRIVVAVIPIHINPGAMMEAVPPELKKWGLRPTTLPELLALGAQHPDVQRQCAPVAAGSVWVSPDGSRYVPYLGYRMCWAEEARSLDLMPYDCPLHPRCRFLAVRTK